MHEADGDRLCAVLEEFPDHLSDLALVERSDRVPCAVHTLRHLTAQMTWGQRRFGHLQEDVVDVIALLAADLQDVPKAPPGEQAGSGACALDERIGDQCGAMDDAGDAFGWQPLAAQQCRARREAMPSCGYRDASGADDSAA